MEISKALIDKYNVPVPRYTSYPTANHFEQEFSETTFIQLLKASNNSQPENIAIYIHIPFCKKICFYCGCNTALYKGEQLVADYIEALKVEVLMLSKYIDKSRKVSQIHYGGGTPNAIDVVFIKEINQLLFDLFEFIPKPEIAIECHPGHLSEAYLRHLLDAGFNRFSLGIQDFNNEVLHAVNRNPSAMPVKEIVAQLRQGNPAVAVNFDFIYGLPHQTVANFTQTIQQAIDIRPDRLVTFSYAHVPWLKKHQQILEKKGLPTSTQKMDLFLTSRELLLNAGYKPIGLDHYVLPQDELFTALQNNQLHRNFQGYCTRRTTGQVYAFGVSSISQFEDGYIQNEKDTLAYIAHIQQGKLATEKGLVLTQHQKLIRAVIEHLMCNQFLDIKAFCEEKQISKETFVKITHFSEDKLATFIFDELLTFDEDIIRIAPIGSFFIRNIAAVFDPAYQRQSNKYSTSV